MSPILAAAAYRSVCGKSSPPVSVCCRCPIFPARPECCKVSSRPGAAVRQHVAFAPSALSGYALGVIAGWSPESASAGPPARYWGMPLLKVVGPIPGHRLDSARDGDFSLGPDSAVGLIALAVWFPVTMLTASGISNTRASYLDVARTLGAGRGYLIFRVAIPAAMPNIFIGFSWDWALVPHPGRRRNRRREVRPGLVCELGAGLGRIRKSLRRAGHHGGVLLHHHDAALQSARPRARLAKGSDQMVMTTDAEGSSLRFAT